MKERHHKVLFHCIELRIVIGHTIKKSNISDFFSKKWLRHLKATKGKDFSSRRRSPLWKFSMTGGLRKNTNFILGPLSVIGNGYEGIPKQKLQLSGQKWGVAKHFSLFGWLEGYLISLWAADRLKELQQANIFSLTM